jgi:hypothetical protein
MEYYSKRVEDWKKGFIELQQQVDMLIIDSDGGLFMERKNGSHPSTNGCKILENPWTEQLHQGSFAG